MQISTDILGYQYNMNKFIKIIFNTGEMLYLYTFTLTIKNTSRKKFIRKTAFLIEA